LAVEIKAVDADVVSAKVEVALRDVDADVVSAKVAVALRDADTDVDEVNEAVLVTVVNQNNKGTIFLRR
jgi:hypothetical protein